ncbi:hypothetical protein Dimus_002969 [Dionaea muscipula]
MSVKELVESATLTSLPPLYHFQRTPDSTDHHEAAAAAFDDIAAAAAAAEEYGDSIPVIDFSLLTSGNPIQRSKTIRDLHHACQEWGFFTVVNHGVPERMFEDVIGNCNEFFDLTAEEKREFEGKRVLDPIRCGTSFNVSAEEVHFWRDFLKLHVHPEFNCPHKPPALSGVLSEYCNRVREMGRVLFQGISLSLGLDEDRIEKALNLESGLEMFVANYYPPCPEPELAMGIPPHSDMGLITVLTHNQVAGLQIQHCGRWVHVNPLPNSFIVNVGDHLEIFSNGRCKSVVHRAVVNNKVARMSVGVVYAPSLDTIVSPAKELAYPAAAYKPMKFREYLESQQSSKLQGKSILEKLRI